jgi:capsule polysaccharide export protein KpsE/RkpR
MSDTNETRDDTISLLDLLAVLARRKWLIVGMTGIIALLTVAFLVAMMIIPSSSRWNYLPVVYKPTAKILLQDASKGSSLSSILNQSGLGALSSLVGVGVGGGGTSADLAKALLASNSIKDTIAREFDFATLLELKNSKAPKTTVRKAIETATVQKYDSKSGILELGYKDIDPVRATEIINRMVDLLDGEFSRLTLDKVASKRKYLEESVAALERETRKVSDQLIAFQVKHGIIDFSTKAEESTKALAQVQSDVITKQLELDLQRKYVPESDSRVVKLKAELEGMRRRLEEMRVGGNGFDTGMVPQNLLPGLSAQYLTLKRDLEIQQTTLGLLKQQLEMAKLEEMDTSRTFQILERAEVPEVRFSPSRTKTALIAAVAGFFLAVLTAFIVEYFSRAAKDPVESAKLEAIRSMFSLRRRAPRE